MFTRLGMSIKWKYVRLVHVEEKIASLGLTLPPPATPKGFVNYTRVGNLVYLSGHLPQPAEGNMVIGKVGKELSVEDGKYFNHDFKLNFVKAFFVKGYEAAKYCGLNLCATLKHNLGDLDKVKRIVKLLGFVNCTDSFTQQPMVINGCSDIMNKVFGEKGVHSRSALGTNSLPFGVAVEVEAIVEVEDEN
jgi:enamine deaminase RidA (YjgF/YER057c/UK114 family)